MTAFDVQMASAPAEFVKRDLDRFDRDDPGLWERGSKADRSLAGVCADVDNRRDFAAELSDVGDIRHGVFQPFRHGEAACRNGAYEMLSALLPPIQVLVHPRLASSCFKRAASCFPAASPERPAPGQLSAVHHTKPQSPFRSSVHR